MFQDNLSGYRVKNRLHRTRSGRLETNKEMTVVVQGMQRQKSKEKLSHSGRLK